MIRDEFLEILCCPETHQSLTLIEGAAIERLNVRVREGTIKNRSGAVVEEPLDGGLLREDRKMLYPIRDGIPVLLIDDAIPFEGLDG